MGLTMASSKRETNDSWGMVRESSLSCYVNHHCDGYTAWTISGPTRARCNHTANKKLHSWQLWKSKSLIHFNKWSNEQRAFPKTGHGPNIFSTVNKTVSHKYVNEWMNTRGFDFMVYLKPKNLHESNYDPNNCSGC